ncbi:MAG: hypothetical protein ABI266_01605, partial [Ginsengibacter sp.]
MAKTFKIYIWKKATFLRLLLPLILGIILEFFFKLNGYLIIIIAISLATVMLVISKLPEVLKFKFRFFHGVV